MTYDAWGKPQTETRLDANFAGLDNLNNFTGYTYDEVLALYFAQNRFYNSETHRFTQEDPIKDGENWYGYCGNNPLVFRDEFGQFTTGDQLTYYGVKNNADDARALQRRLLELGYYKGAIDGVFGEGTLKAVNAYKDAYLPNGNTKPPQYLALPRKAFRTPHAWVTAQLRKEKTALGAVFSYAEATGGDRGRSPPESGSNIVRAGAC